MKTMHENEETIAPPASEEDTSRPHADGGNPESAEDPTANAAEALVAGDWDVSSSFGSVTVELSPRNCGLIASVAGGVAGYSGRKFVDSLFSGKPWYMPIIWGLIMADAGYVSTSSHPVPKKTIGEGCTGAYSPGLSFQPSCLKEMCRLPNLFKEMFRSQHRTSEPYIIRIGKTISPGF